jgi:hypothetical protein
MRVSPRAIAAVSSLVFAASAQAGSPAKAAAGGADTATKAYLAMRRTVCAPPVTAAKVSATLSAFRRGVTEEGVAVRYFNCKAKVTVAKENPPDGNGMVELMLAGTENGGAIQGGAYMVKEGDAWKLDNLVIVPK